MLKWAVTKRSEASGCSARTHGQALRHQNHHERRSLGTFGERIANIGGGSLLPARPRDDFDTYRKVKARRSLGTAVHGNTNCDKENRCITSTPHSTAGRSAGDIAYSSALRDVSNITPNTTPCRLPSLATPRNRKRSLAAASSCDFTGGKRICQQEVSLAREPFATTLPTFDVEYSPCGVKNVPSLAPYGLGLAELDKPSRYFLVDGGKSSPAGNISTTPNVGPSHFSSLSTRLSSLRVNKGASFKMPVPMTTTVNSNDFQESEENEQSMNSSEMGDLTLDRMIDAILESAKKDTKWETPRPKRSSSLKSKQSKGSSPTYTPADDPAADLYLLERRLPQRLVRQEASDTTVIIEASNHVNEREVKTPDQSRERGAVSTQPGLRQSLNRFLLASPLEASCYLRRQKAVRRKHGKHDSGGHRKTQTLHNDHCSISPETPNVSFNQSRIDQLALAKTPVPKYDEECRKQKQALEPHKEQASANPSMLSIELRGTSTPTSSIEHSRKCLSFSPSLSEDSMETRRSVASLASSRCSRSIPAMRGTLDLTISFDQSSRLQVHVIRCQDLQRAGFGSTAINAYVKVALINPGSPLATHSVQRTAVHRNSSRPSFDHRFFFDVLPDDDRRIQLAVWHRDRGCRRSEFLGCMSFAIQNVSNQMINGAYRLQPQSCLTNPVTPILDTMCENSQSSVDEIVSVEDASSGTMALGTGATTAMTTLGGGTTKTVNTGSIAATCETLSLSKKALHQRDADENLFLRFLELDPSPDVAPSLGTGSLVIPVTPRRNSVNSYKPASASAGRTPFTITKRLARAGDRGFGFSIVWTHPPRVEKVEPGLSAEKAGILPGDYVVFVEKLNVVTLPEQDVLNLIRSQGNTLLLEIFRRPQHPSGHQLRTNGLRSSITEPSSTSAIGSNNAISYPPYSALGGVSGPFADEPDPSLKTNIHYGVARSSTACSNVSIETAKRKLHLPQVTFSKESIVQQFPDDHRRKFLYQLISREQHFINAIIFGIERFVNPLRERKDLISPNDHKILFQNIDELSRISEDILEQIMQGETEPQIHFASRVYLSKSTALCAGYRKYCNGLKKADCVLVNKSRNTNCDFMKFITEPPVPRKRPDLTTFIHRPLQHFREILKLVQMIASHCRVDSEEHNNFNSIISELQAAYREITVGGGLMEPIGEGRPLLTLQDLEARMVFTKCKPFQLASYGRQWIFGGDLSRVEGRSIKPYWTLLFSDILLFAKVSRDRVLFITEEPIPLSTITDSCFNIRKKGTEFRITTDPNGRQIESPTVYCAPDLTRTPKKNSKKRHIVLRAPSTELKAVWQNLLTRQIFLVNATIGSTPLSSPLDSPDILQSLVPISDVGTSATARTSVTVPSLDSIHLKNQQSRLSRVPKQVEELIDAKCRKLNKTGVPQGSALHLAQWMKGQLDKQVVESDPIDSDPEQLVEEWSVEQVTNRSKELNLVHCEGSLYQPSPNGNGTSSGNGLSKPVKDGPYLIDDSSAFEDDDDNKSVSKSTTSDSQITVRSSPLSNKVDTVSMCRQCHKNCRSRLNSSSSNSLTVQHSQSISVNPCCMSISATSSSLNKSPNSQSSMSSSSTLTTREKFGVCKNDNNGGNVKNVIVPPPSDQTRSPLKPASENYRTRCQTPCHCKCTPKDFEQSTLSPDELLYERVKILENVNELNANSVAIQPSVDTNKLNGCLPNKQAFTKTLEGDNNNEDAEWSMVGLFSLSQIKPATVLAKMDPFEALPTIAVVPPTPDAMGNTTGRHTMHLSMPWSTETHQLQLNLTGQSNDEYSPDNSPEDEIIEPPYKALNAGLKRYGTISSLERVPSEETDDNKTYNSSEEDSECDIKIVTKEVYDNNTQTFLNWTTRAGNFIEESRAFIDRYLGRRDNSAEDADDNNDQDSAREKHHSDHAVSSGGDEEEVIEGETSATSGEEVWGTPTSGGDNDDMQIFGSIEQTHSSPTKSSSSYTGDEDTELMMDELLMAPPMTASAVRGLLPRRKLEPLFEEESESYESDDDNKLIHSGNKQGQVLEKNPLDCADLKDSTESESVSTTPSSIARVEMNESIKTTTPEESYGSVADKCYASVQLPSTGMLCANGTELFAGRGSAPVGLSPRMEMRLALNHDILGSQDLLTYSPGSDLTTILGRDLSTYHRMSGKDVIMNHIVTRASSFTNIQTAVTLVTKNSAEIERPLLTSSASASQMQKNGTSSSYQQNNSKMDTPIPKRRIATAQATWSSFGSADREEKTLTDLERLARREKVYCMTQFNQNDTNLKNTANYNSKSKQSSKLLNFLSRHNSENQLMSLFASRDNVDVGSACHSASGSVNSPRKETVKSLDRRFWKQLSKRRRSSVHEMTPNGS